MRNKLLVIILTIFSLVVFTSNLGAQDYSFDEAAALVVGASIDNIGIPSAWDGQNLLSWNNGKDITIISDAYLWAWDPWLQHYLTFASLNIFGKLPQHTRLVFTLFGVASLLLLYRISKEIFQDSRVAFLGGLHLCLLLPFVLYIRQVRYYSLGTFFSLVIFWFAIKLYKNMWQRADTLLLISSSVLLFLSQPILWFSSMFAFVIMVVMKRNNKLLVVIVGQFFLALVWLYYFSPAGGGTFSRARGLSHIVNNVAVYISYIHMYVFSALLIPLVFIGKKYRNYLMIIMVLLVVRFAAYSSLVDAHGRFVVDSMPLFILLIGFVYDWLLRKKHVAITLLLFLGLISINSYPQKLFIELTQEKKPHVFPQVSKYMGSTYEDGDLFWSNAYRWDIYHYAHIPHLSPAYNPTTQMFAGPGSVTNINNVKWFIFFQEEGPQQTLEEYFGENWESILEEKYERKIISLKKDTIMPNSPDIVVRSFPAKTAPGNYVVIFERTK